jgi:hypothetical protein
MYWRYKYPSPTRKASRATVDRHGVTQTRTNTVCRRTDCEAKRSMSESSFKLSSVQPADSDSEEWPGRSDDSKFRGRGTVTVTVAAAKAVSAPPPGARAGGGLAESPRRLRLRLGATMAIMRP